AINLVVEDQLVAAQIQLREDAVSGEEVIADDAATREQVLLVDVVLLLIPRQQEVELRLERMSTRVVVELTQERIVRRLEDQTGAEAACEEPRESRLAHANGSFDDQIAWAHVHLCNIGSIEEGVYAGDAAPRRPASGTVTDGARAPASECVSM